MAIYSLNMRSIGRRTHAAGTAGAHIRYIARADAEPHLMAGQMPDDPLEARSFLDRGERADRKNARVIDKIRIALPLELDPVQRAELVREFADRLTEGRVPWYAAIHQSGKDAQNPHVHFVIRDRDIETGKRHVRLSDSARDWQKAGRPDEHPVQHVRGLWERTCNEALERQGIDARIDRRTLEAQGIDRTPQIHMGPQGQHVETNKHRPESQEVPERSWRRTQYRETTPYPDIDLGRTRKERNAEIIDLNIERAARSADFETRKWAEFEREQAAKDRVLERARVEEARQQESERDKVRQRARAAREDIYARRADEQKWARIATERVWQARRASLAEEQESRSASLQEAQGRFSARFLRVVDITGRTKAKQDEERARLEEAQARERREMDAEAKRQDQIQQDAVKARYAAEVLEVRARRKADLRALEDKHLEKTQRHQLELQYRESERAQAKDAMAQQIAEWKRQAKDQEAAKANAEPRAVNERGAQQGPKRAENDEGRAKAKPEQRREAPAPSNDPGPKRERPADRHPDRAPREEKPTRLENERDERMRRFLEEQERQERERGPEKDDGLDYDL